jgi:ubiquinone/menaquinone biosynthesis C-methylase UbiE
MTDPISDSSQVVESWDQYWQGIVEAEAYSAGGVSHPAISGFWKQFFQAIEVNYIKPSIIDIATGSGAVVEQALSVLADSGAEITCIDASDAAIASIRSRFPAVHGLVAEARSIPLDSGEFQIVTSQFGVEYAGPEAVDEAGRLLAEGGRLALLLHNQGGSMHRECTASLEAISRLRDSRFIPYAMEMFRAGFGAVHGADRAPYDAAAARLAPAVQALEEIMEQYGEHVAGDTVASLYEGVANIHSKIQQYDPDEVLGWLDRLDGEMETFARRMSSMVDSALDGEAFKRICASLCEQGCTIEKAGPLLAPGRSIALAWALMATR